MYQWIYSCRIAGQFTSSYRSRACLTIPRLSGITIYRNTLRPSWTPDHFGPSFRSHLWSFWSEFVWQCAPPSLSHCVLVLGHLGPLTFPLSFFFFFFFKKQGPVSFDSYLFWRYFLSSFFWLTFDMGVFYFHVLDRHSCQIILPSWNRISSSSSSKQERLNF